MLKHYVEFLHPGIMVSETSVKEVGERDPVMIALPPRTFGFRFFDREEITVSGETLRGEQKNFSGWYYEGESYDLERLKRERPAEHILIENMETNHYAAVVMTRYGQAFPLRDGDIALGPHGGDSP